MLHYALYIFLEAEVSLSLQSGTGWNKLTCMAVYSSAHPTSFEMLSPIGRRGDNWP